MAPHGSPKKAPSDHGTSTLTEEEAQVRSLHHQTLPPAVPESNFAKIQELKANRRLKQDGAHRDYEAFISELSEKLEDEIIKQADSIRDQLDSADKQLARQFQSVEDEAVLVSKDYEFLVSLWLEIEQFCKNRTAAISHFGDSLEQIEESRSRQAEQQLRRMAMVLLYDSAMPPTEAQRVLETEICELNLVLISNRKSYAELLSRMFAKDVLVLADCRKKWEDIVVKWRNLKHETALHRFRSDLEGEEYTDPKERREILQDFKEKQKQRHEEIRLTSFRQLGRLSSESLSEEAVMKVKKVLEELREIEEEESGIVFKKLEGCNALMLEKMGKRREALRAELHRYGALFPIPDGLALQKEYAALMQDESNEEFFRKSGGLKSELKFIEEKLGSPNLIYDEETITVLARISLLESSLGLSQMLEEQGKSSLKKVLQETLEKMRTAHKDDVGGISQALDSPLSLLIEINGLAENVRTEFKKLLVDLRECRVGGAGGGRSMAGSSSVATEQLSRLRTVQRSLGSLLASSELTEEWKRAVRRGKEVLEQQLEANKVIDRVVQEQCQEVIEKRANEQRDLLKAFGIALDQQAVMLHRSAEKITSFYHSLSTLLSSHSKEVIHNDEEVKDKLWDLDISFDEERKRQETAYSTALALLRQSPDDTALERQFTVCLSLLDDIEKFYRNHAEQGVKYSEEHPMVLSDIETRFEFQILKHFRLLLPSDQSTGAEESKEIDRTLTMTRSSPSVLPSSSSLDDTQGRAAAPVIPASAAAIAEAQSVPAGTSPSSLSSKERERGQKRRQKGEKKLAPPSSPRYITKAGRAYKELLTCDDLAATMVNVSPFDEVEEERERILLALSSPPTVSTLSDVSTSPSSQPATEASAVPAPPQEPSMLPVPVGPRLAGNEGQESKGENAQLGGSISSNVISPEELEKVSAALSSENQAVNAPLPNTLSIITTEEDTKSKLPPFTPPTPFELQIPTTGAGETCSPCFLSLSLPLEELSGMLRRIRDEVMTKMEEFSASQIMESHRLCAERKGEYVLQLEERLRKHWPRKGRTDVKFYQPRLGELITHKQRNNRQLRALATKDQALEERFQLLLMQGEEDVENYFTAHYTLMASLPMQNSLAAYQGLEKKAKNAKKAFEDGLLSLCADLEVLAVQEPLSLVRSVEEFVSGCEKQTFQLMQKRTDAQAEDLEKDGEADERGGGDAEGFVFTGDYNKEEIERIREMMRNATEEIMAKGKLRLEKISSLRSRASEAKELMTSFQARLDTCVQSLSMIEGLGQKYGAPRRRAGERLRSEMTRCDFTLKEVEELLSHLQALVDLDQAKEGTDGAGAKAASVQLKEEEKVMAMPMPPDFLGKKVRSLPLSQRITIILVQLHQRTLDMAKYFGALSPSLPLSLLSLSLLPQEGVSLSSYQEECASLQADHTFEQVTSEILDSCKSDTLSLFKQEGKEDELPDGDIPPSLRAYLEDQKKHSLAFQDNARKKLREHVDWLQQLLLFCPSMALDDLNKRYLSLARSQGEKSEKAFKEKYEDLENRRQKHNLSLRPQLAAPQAKAQLQALVEKETERKKSAEKLILEYRELALKQEAGALSAYEPNFIGTFANLVQLLDKTLTRMDFKPIPGDSEQPVSRKSLKRLRKLARRTGLHGSPSKEETEQGRHEAGESHKEDEKELSEFRQSHRQWSGIPEMGKYREQMQKLVKESTPRPSTSASSASRPPSPSLPSREAVDAPSAAEERKEGAQERENLSQGVEKVGQAGECSSHVSSAHRRLMRSRDELFSSFGSSAVARANILSQDCSSLLSKERAWAKTWSQAVQSLTDSAN